MAAAAVSPILVNSGQAVGQAQAAPAARAVQNAGRTFEEMLSSLNQSQAGADAYVQKLALGESVDLHDVMLNLEQNDVQFKVALAIRDHLVEAYREMMRMQV